VKILITTFTFFPNKDGVAIACASLCDFLVKSGHKVFVATSRAPGTSSNCRRQGIYIRRFAIYNSRLPESSDLEKSKYLKYLISGKFDLIINQNWDSWTTELFLKVSKKLSGKRIFVSHGLSKHIFHFCEKPFWGLGPWLKGLKWSFSFLPRIFQAHDAFVFLADKSDWGRFFDLKICKNFFPGRTWIIPNTITDLHLARKSPSVRTSLLGGRSLLLVYVANFCDRKDQLRAVRIFTNSGLRNSVLVLVGTEANEYSHLVSGWIRRNKHRLDLQDQQILVYTGLSRKKTLDFTASSDLVLLTAKSETQPLVLIEAMALKKPWVSTISGCIDKMKGGLPCRTDYQLIEAVRRLSQSKILRQSLVAEGTRAYAKYYSPKVFVCGWERLIKVISPQHP